MDTLRHIVATCLLLTVSLTTGHTALAAVVVKGKVVDAETDLALFPATLRVAGTNSATVTNPDGRFEIVVSDLPVILVCSHIGFRSDSLRVATGTDTVLFRMVPVMLEMAELVVTAEDPAISIMRKVIERKQERKGALRSLKANAYSRFTVRKDTTIVSVIESMSEAYWREGQGWREILKAKRTTRNMKEDVGMPAAAFMENLYEDDVEVAGHTLQGVTHPHALETYDFELENRRRMDDRIVYDITVRSKSPRSSAFEGKISVLDEAYTLLEVHLTPNASFLFPPPFQHFEVAFHQQFRPFDDDWLPVDLRTEVRLRIGILGFRIPPIRSEQVTRISDYEVNAVFPDSLFREKKPIISDVSSKSAPDSLMAVSGVVVPLTDEEKVAFSEIDSTETLDKVFKPEGALASLMGDRRGGTSRGTGNWKVTVFPYGWFNRAEGFHASLRPRAESGDRRTRIRTEVGYSQAIERWSFGGELWRFWGKTNIYRVRVSYRRGSSPRQTSNLYSNFNATTGLFGGEDYFDYYWQEAFRLQGRYKARSIRTDFVPGLRVERHQPLAKSTDFAILSDFVQRPNPAIDAGDLRSLTFRVTHGGDGGPVAIVGEHRLQLLVEHSSPNLMGSDFDFTQFRFYAGWRFPTSFSRRMLPNVLDVTISAGTVRGRLPLQRFGHLDASLERWHNPGTFRTLHAHPYEGEHYFGAFWEHHFRTLPFEYLGWDALVERSIGLIVYGGHGRTWISDARLAALPYDPQYVDRFHHEIGASVNGLFGLLRVDFTKRLDAAGYTFGFGFARIF